MAVCMSEDWRIRSKANSLELAAELGAGLCQEAEAFALEGWSLCHRPEGTGGKCPKLTAKSRIPPQKRRDAVLLSPFIPPRPQGYDRGHPYLGRFFLLSVSGPQTYPELYPSARLFLNQADKSQLAVTRRVLYSQGIHPPMSSQLNLLLVSEACWERKVTGDRV